MASVTVHNHICSTCFWRRKKMFGRKRTIVSVIATLSLVHSSLPHLFQKISKTFLCTLCALMYPGGGMRLKEPRIKSQFKRSLKPLLFATDLIGARWAYICSVCACSAIINIPKSILSHILDSIGYSVSRLQCTVHFMKHILHSLNS